jgi:hypothetical protein
VLVAEHVHGFGGAVLAQARDELAGRVARPDDDHWWHGFEDPDGCGRPGFYGGIGVLR